MVTGAQARMAEFPSAPEIPYDKSPLRNVISDAPPELVRILPILIHGTILTQLSVNHQRYTVDAPDDTPLLWALRDHLHLVGTKYGCGIALCGACTVLVDGVATRVVKLGADSCEIWNGEQFHTVDQGVVANVIAAATGKRPRSLPLAIA
jgi:hypothetical protein